MQSVAGWFWHRGITRWLAIAVKEKAVGKDKGKEAFRGGHKFFLKLIWIDVIYLLILLMRPPLTLLTAFLFFAVLYSCKKSNSSTGGGSVQGNWKVLFLTAQTQASSMANGLTTITKTSYKTTNNGGTVAFTADSMIITGLTYSVDTVTWVYLYLGSVLLDSVVQAFSLQIPAYNQTTACKQIGNDSLYFPNGGLTAGSASGTSTVSQPAGARYVISKDTLKMNVLSSETVMGISETLNGTLYLLKQ